MQPTADETIRTLRVQTPTSAMVDNLSRPTVTIDIFELADLIEEIVLP